jgi:UPF0716 protein FxsA
MRRFLEVTAALAIVEILVIVEVASLIGVVNTLGLLIIGGVVGTLLVKMQGVAALGRVLEDVQEQRVPGPALADGALRVTAGVLVAIPGFLTDVAGLLLLFEPVRAAVRRRVRRRFVARGFVIVRGNELEA